MVGVCISHLCHSSERIECTEIKQNPKGNVDVLHIWLIVDEKQVTCEKAIANAMNIVFFFTSIALILLANRHDLASETAPEAVSSDIRTYSK